MNRSNSLPCHPDLVDELVPSLYEVHSSSSSNVLQASPILRSPIITTPKTSSTIAQVKQHVATQLNSKTVPQVHSSNVESNQNGPARSNVEIEKTSDHSVPTIQSNQNAFNVPVSIENHHWFKLLPHDALKFYVEQDLLIKSLKDKICELKSKLSNSCSQSKIDIGIQVSSSQVVEKVFKHVSINTGEVADELLPSTTCTPKRNHVVGKVLFCALCC